MSDEVISRLRKKFELSAKFELAVFELTVSDLDTPSGGVVVIYPGLGTTLRPDTLLGTAPWHRSLEVCNDF